MLNFVKHSILTLTNSWYRKKLGLFNYLLLPLSWIFSLLSKIRSKLYQKNILKIYKVPIPVIVIGNITIGGNGKTPFVLWLANYLTKRKFRVGILSFGYGGRCKSPHQVSVFDSSDYVGDEPLLLARNLKKCVVMIARKRWIGAKLLYNNFKCDILISDDGLSHYKMERNIEIILIDKKNGLGNGCYLPAGPLRETKDRLMTADFVVYSYLEEGNITAFKKKDYSMISTFRSLKPINNKGQKISLKQLKNRTVHAIAGILHPQNFFDLLKGYGLKVISHPFPDHYKFSRRDIYFDDDNLVIMTEKDAVKCFSFSDSRHYFIPLKSDLDKNFKKDFNALLYKNLKREKTEF